MIRGDERRYRRVVRRTALAAAVVLGAALITVSGCSPMYVLRAGYEEAKILWRREPMERFAARPGLDPAIRAKLETVLAARTFARERGLDVGGSFASVSHLDGEHNVFVVTAAKRTALEPYTWWFPIVGRVPYKGFFSRARAEAEAAGLRDDGWDTFVRGASAFSTLGWFDDPLLEHQLRHDEGYLVNLVLHELYHNTFFVAGKAAFNESAANFVGHRGAIEFFRGRDDDARTRLAEQAWDEELRFGALLGRLAARLRARYAAARDVDDAVRARDEEVTKARAELDGLGFARERFASFRTQPLNNAMLLQYLLYNTDLDVFDAIYRQRGDLRRALDFIEAAAKEKKSDPFGAVQSALATLSPATEEARTESPHVPTVAGAPNGRPSPADERVSVDRGAGGDGGAATRPRLD